jgi:hypothetical protein
VKTHVFAGYRSLVRYILYPVISAVVVLQRRSRRRYDQNAAVPVCYAVIFKGTASGRVCVEHTHSPIILAEIAFQRRFGCIPHGNAVEIVSQASVTLRRS